MVSLLYSRSSSRYWVVKERAPLVRLMKPLATMHTYCRPIIPKNSPPVTRASQPAGRSSPAMPARVNQRLTRLKDAKGARAPGSRQRRVRKAPSPNRAARLRITSKKAAWMVFLSL